MRRLKIIKYNLENIIKLLSIKGKFKELILSATQLFGNIKLNLKNMLLKTMFKG